MVTDVDAILTALKTTVEAIEFTPQPEVFVDEPVTGLKPASVVLILTEIERGAVTVAETELGSYDWTLTVQAQIFFELTQRTTNAQVSARQYSEALIRAIDVGTDLDLVLEDSAKATKAERVGLTDNGQSRLFETWTVEIELPALISY